MKKNRKKVVEKTINIVIEGTLLPPRKDVCQKCAVDHSPDQPHNQQSIYWQYWFYKDTGGKRWPTWKDAMSHCPEQIQKFWIEELAKHGVEVK